MTVIRPAEELLEQPFWQHLANGSLHLNCCKECGTYRHPPGPVCPHCRTIGNDWAPVSGKATLQSYTTVHHPVHPKLKDLVPYVVTLVRLEEGPRFVSSIPHGEKYELKVGMALECKIVEVDADFAIPCFVPVSKDSK